MANKVKERDTIMNIHFEPPPIYFMHVPKTGGTALGRWLRSCYRGRDCINLGVPLLHQYREIDLPQFRCYHSFHLGRSMFDLIGRSNLTAITMLRSPVERVASEFEHRRRVVSNHPERFTEAYLEQICPILYTPLQECLDHDIVTHILSNGQARTLGRRVDITAYLKHANHDQPHTPILQPYNLHDLIDLKDQVRLFANAKSWLAEMPVVGLTERYAESVVLIADRLGIPTPAELPSANINPQRSSPTIRYQDQLSPDVVTQLEELNRYDMELYAYASELFAQQWARYQAQPRRTYSIAAHGRSVLQPVRLLRQQAVKRFS